MNNTLLDFKLKKVMYKIYKYIYSKLVLYKQL